MPKEQGIAGRDEPGTFVHHAKRKWLPVVDPRPSLHTTSLVDNPYLTDIVFASPYACFDASVSKVCQNFPSVCMSNLSRYTSACLTPFDR